MIGQFVKILIKKEESMDQRGVKTRKRNLIKKGSGLFELRPPEYFSVPLLAADGDMPVRAVNVGEKVCEGSLIAKPSGRYGSFVYSPCSGKVVGIVRKLNANGNECEHVVIERDLENEKELMSPLDALEQTPEQLLKRLYMSGMTDNFMPYEPAYKKYLLKCNIKTLIINCTEDDPYQSCDSAMIETLTSEVVEGARLLKKLCKADQIVFIFTLANMSAETSLRNHIKKLGDKTIKIKTYSNVYPLHNSRLIAYYETGKMVVRGARTAQIGVIVESVSNCLDFYNAVMKGIPCTQRAVSVTGKNTLRKANYFIKNGTPISHVLKLVGTKKEYDDNMLIYGGIMSGIAQETLDISVGLGASVIIFTDSGDYEKDNETPCINCGRCLRACPVRLNVKRLDDAITLRRFDMAKKLGVDACIDCGACSYVCPAKRFLAQRMSFAKDIVDGKVGKKPTSSNYILIEGEDLTRQGVEFETDTKKINETQSSALPEIDEMLKVLNEKTKQEEEEQARKNQEMQAKLAKKDAKKNDEGGKK